MLCTSVASGSGVTLVVVQVCEVYEFRKSYVEFTIVMFISIVCATVSWSRFMVYA